MLIKFYRFLSHFLFPFYLKWAVTKRLRKRKEKPERLKERYGEATLSRPKGTLIWVHGASVGESLTAVPFIERLKEISPKIFFLVTTGTVTSAEILEKRLPARSFHQFIPFDTPRGCEKFLDFWKPDLALWIESEIWPNLIFETKKRSIPLILVNGRISKRTYNRWKLLKKTSRKIFSQFDLCLVQSEHQANWFKELGALSVKVGGNLKFTSSPLKYEDKALKELQKVLKRKNVWLAACTHEGEESVIKEAHHILKKRIPHLLTLLAPRHPDRSRKIQKQLGKIETSLRSEHPIPPLEAEFYIIDTLGELGLFYKLCPVSFIGGSLVPIGGHSLIEAAQLGSLILHGPYMHKTQEMRDLFQTRQASIEVKDSQELATQIEFFLSTLEKRTPYIKNAQAIIQEQQKILEEFLFFLSPYLPSFASKRTNNPTLTTL